MSRFKRDKFVHVHRLNFNFEYQNGNLTSGEVRCSNAGQHELENSNAKFQVDQQRCTSEIKESHRYRCLPNLATGIHFIRATTVKMHAQ